MKTNFKKLWWDSGEWRGYYFENAHRQVWDILRAARLARPEAHFAREKHQQFIRYYELVDTEFNKIGAQLSVNPDVDYVRQLMAKMDEPKPIRNAWVEWADPKKSSSGRSPVG